MIYETTTFPYLHEIRRFRRNVEWFPSHLIGVGRLVTPEMSQIPEIKESPPDDVTMGEMSPVRVRLEWLMLGGGKDPVEP